METFVLLTEKSWHKTLFQKLKAFYEDFNWVLIDNEASFSEINLAKIKPSKIFIPHWSYIISESIFNNYECIVFHMTDLPFGRGGSPLQNLIVRGFQSTKITALRVSEGLDKGDIYLKSDLSLLGTAEEIFIRSSNTILEMISEIISKKPSPVPQIGEATLFKRRKPAEGNLEALKSIEQVYDYIRMLDAEGYPNAYIENEHFRFEFTRASLKSKNKIIADVRIIKK